MFPHWSLVVLTAFVSLILKPCPRSRIGLGGLLVAVTIAGIVLATILVLVKTTYAGKYPETHVSARFTPEGVVPNDTKLSRDPWTASPGVDGELGNSIIEVSD